ncbi:MAG: Crp/Fnr family transcriptional regulator [Pyrinomonadaceae bacterium]|nr:Crp/Fnr family transcriptional regulator [Pyrinomonadaceae bacterium]
MSVPERKRASRWPGGSSVYSLATATPGTHRAIAARLKINRPRNIPEPIPFNGLLTNSVLANLPGSEFEELLRYLEPVSLLAGHELYGFQQKIIDYAYFPETAVVSHLYLLEDGSTSGASIVGSEGMVGLSAILGSGPPSYWTQIIVGGSALRVRAEVIKREFARGRALQQLLLSHISARLAQLAQRAICNGRHRVQERLCTWLLMIQDRVSEEKLPLTQEQIAHHLGARRPGITASCTALRENGIISYHRGLISIRDRTTLEASACECYRALRRPATAL